MSLTNPSPNRTMSTLHQARSEVRGRGGMVAAKNELAVDAGLTMLERGGNAIDAAVATAFAVGVVEPWMSGVGGGGYLVAWLAEEQRPLVIAYPMLSPQGATPDMFELAEGQDSALFGWPSTVDNANVVGHRAAAVPGTVAGLALALERYGTLPLATVMEPAIALAEDGAPVTWHTTYFTGRDFGNLKRFPSTAEIYLNTDGNPPFSPDTAPRIKLRNPHLAKLLRDIVDQGPRVFYEGEIAETIATHLAEHGSSMTTSDFANYEAREEEPITLDYQGHRVHTLGKGTGGTSMAQALKMLANIGVGSYGPESPQGLHQMIQAFQQAFADRFAYLADPEHPEGVDVPIDALLDPAYIAECVAAFTPGLAQRPTAGDRARLGVTHRLPASVPGYVRDESTTHLDVVDAAGNAVSITQTLLSAWGSRVVAPGTGVLLNNGMMWFDPQPGRPNSIAGGKRPLSNMAPALITRDGELVAALGSSGGRKIMNYNAQLISDVLDHNMSVPEAIHAPKLDTSTIPIVMSRRFSPDVLTQLAEMGHEISIRDETLSLDSFASPTGIHRAIDGVLQGAADPYYYPATVGLTDPSKRR